MANINHNIAQSGFIGAGLGVSTAPCLPNTIQQAESLLEDMIALCSRLHSIVDRLCGSEPMPPISGDGDLPNGALPRLSDRVRTTRCYINDASAALDRLDRELP